jgi:hypothetical protein
MKSPLQLIVVATLVMLCKIAIAQSSEYPVAVCNNGILLGKYVIKYEDRGYIENPSADTIALADAKSIFAINVIGIHKDKHLQRIAVKKFDMGIIEKGDTLIIKGASGILSEEMKKKLQNIHSGAQLFFEGIFVSFNNSPSPSSILLLSFIVI